jgi:hypothetical protein
LEKQQQFGTGGGIGSGETSMLTAELNDYKNAIGIVRKELQECKERLTEKESLIEVFDKLKIYFDKKTNQHIYPFPIFK